MTGCIEKSKQVSTEEGAANQEPAVVTDAPSIIPMQAKFGVTGLSWTFPAEAAKGDARAMLACADPSVLSQLPSSIFGGFKSPFDIKEMNFNKGRIVTFSTHTQLYF